MFSFFFKKKKMLSFWVVVFFKKKEAVVFFIFEQLRFIEETQRFGPKVAFTPFLRLGWTYRLLGAISVDFESTSAQKCLTFESLPCSFAYKF